MNYLVTGGTGSWGNELTKQLLAFEDTERITIFSRNEYNQVAMQRKFNNSKLKFVIGDVRDSEAVEKACRGVSVLYHLGALKHVPICEGQPEEAIKTNIIGTQNVISGALKNKVKRVIDVSTDKACAPNNLYGMTKAIGEKLILHADTQGETRFICIRAGNVLGSAGSVVPLFIQQIEKYNSMTLTNGEMTRYFMSLPEAIKLVLTASKLEVRGKLLVMKMPSCTINDLAETIGYLYGNEVTTIKHIGSRPGEKVHEMLVSEAEALSTYIYNDDYYLVSDESLSLSKVDFKYYSSNSQKLLNREGIIGLLAKGGFVPCQK